MPSPFARFNRQYHFLFRWDEDVCPRRDNLDATVRDAVDIALAFARVRPALARYSGAERELIRSIAAGIALHGSGVFAERLAISTADLTIPGTIADRLMTRYTSLHQDRTKGEVVARALGLRKNEIEAVWAYTQANKEVEDLSGQVNPAFMMTAFGSFTNGWQALTSALSKLPSFGRLGMTVSTFRTVRNRDEIERLKALPIGSRLVLGCTPMKGGQRHVTSSAITMSKWTLPATVLQSGGVLSYFGVSGVFINWLGQYGLGMDGGETLYSPGTIMQLSAKVQRDGYDGKVPIFLLEEIPMFHEADVGSRTEYYDDYSFRRIKDPREITAARASARFFDLLDLESQHDGPLTPKFQEI